VTSAISSKRYRNGKAISPRLGPGITRVDNHHTRTHGWKVFLQRRKQVVTKLFSDGVWDGRKKALAAAKRFHQQTRRTLPRLNLADYCQIKKRNNRSGISGVSRHVQRRQSGGKSIYWIASCPIGHGGRRHIKFSVTKLGEQQALAKAIAARRRALQTLTRLPVWRFG
jgi:hypothetical protein